MVSEQNQKFLRFTHGTSIRSDSDHTIEKCKTINSNKEQDQCMLRCRQNRENNPGNYELFSRQCTSFVKDCLSSCGLPNGSDIKYVLPRSLYQDLPIDSRFSKAGFTGDKSTRWLIDNFRDIKW